VGKEESQRSLEESRELCQATRRALVLLGLEQPVSCQAQKKRPLDLSQSCLVQEQALAPQKQERLPFLYLVKPI
jgi:hypothetical protein